MSKEIDIFPNSVSEEIRNFQNNKKEEIDILRVVLVWWEVKVLLFSCNFPFFNVFLWRNKSAKNSPKGGFIDFLFESLFINLSGLSIPQCSEITEFLGSITFVKSALDFFLMANFVKTSWLCATCTSWCNPVS